MAKKKPVDNTKYMKDTGQRFRDRIYNWVVARYGKKGNAWSTSDTVVWQGAIYEAPSMIGYVVSVALFWALAEVAMRVRGDGIDPTWGLMFLIAVLLARFGRMTTFLKGVHDELKFLNGRKGSR